MSTFGPLGDVDADQEDSDAGLYVPNNTISLGGRAALSEHGELHFGFESSGFGDAVALQRGAIRPPSEMPWGVGAGVTIRGTLTRSFFGSFGADLFLFQIPSHIRITCIENCEYSSDGGDSSDSTTMPIARMFGTLGIDRHRGYGYLILATGNQPSNDVTDIETTRGSPDRSADVNPGGFFLLTGLGGGVRIVESFELVGSLWTLLDDGPLGLHPAGSIGFFLGNPR